MFDKDISDDDFKNIIIPFNDNYNMFLESYIIPEIVAFYIANSFYREAMCEGSFEQFFNSALDIFNFNDVSFEKVKEEIVKLLKIKYAVKIIDEDPFILATTKRS